MSWFALFIVPLLVTLLAAHIERNGGSIAEHLVRMAAVLVPAHERDDQRAEWIDHVRAAGRRGMAPVVTALSIGFVAAPVIAVLARFDAGRRRDPESSRTVRLEGDLRQVIYHLHGELPPGATVAYALIARKADADPVATDRGNADEDPSQGR